MFSENNFMNEEYIKNRKDYNLDDESLCGDVSDMDVNHGYFYAGSNGDDTSVDNKDADK